MIERLPGTAKKVSTIAKTVANKANRVDNFMVPPLTDAVTISCVLADLAAPPLPLYRPLWKIFLKPRTRVVVIFPGRH